MNGPIGFFGGAGGSGGSGPAPTPPVNLDAQTTTTADFVQPAVGANVDVSVLDSSQAFTGYASGIALVYGTGIVAGLYTVEAAPDAVTVTLKNFYGFAGLPSYVPTGFNQPVGVTVPSGSLVIFVKNFAEYALLFEVARAISATPLPTVVQTAYVQPASLATVDVRVSDPQGYNIGDTVYVDGGGFYGVVALLPATLQLTLLNVPTPWQVAPAVVVPVGSVASRPYAASNIANDTTFTDQDVRIGPFLKSVLDFIQAELLGRVTPATPMPTAVTTDYVQPAVAGTVVVTVDDGFGFVVGNAVYIDSGGLYSVTLVAGNDLTLLNTGAPYNAAPAANVLAGSDVNRPYRADQILDDSDMAPHGPWVTDALNKLAQGNVNTIYVDAQRAASDPTLATGTYGMPFPTLQSASDAIPVATDAASMAILTVVYAADADYDEALNVDVTGKRVIFVAAGMLGLGLFEGGFGDPTSRRNLTLSGDTALVGGAETFFGWTTLANLVGSSGADFNPIGARISGQILDVTTDSSAGSGFCAREIHGQVFGDTGTVITPAGTAYDDSGSSVGDGSVSLVLTDAFFYGAVNAPKTELQATRTSFPLALVCNIYSFVRECAVLSAFSAIFGPEGAANPNEAPNGFVSCNFGPASTISLGTGTALVHKLVLDGSSMQSLLTHGVVVTGGTGTVLTTFAAAAVLDFGATLALLAAPFAIAGGAPNAAATATQATALTEKPLARPARLLRFAWRTAAADATTRIDVRVNTVSVVTLALTGATGAIDTEIAVVAGDRVALEYTAGTAPGNGTYQLSS